VGISWKGEKSKENRKQKSEGGVEKVRKKIYRQSRIQ
jgi:hypothetical protein